MLCVCVCCVCLCVCVYVCVCVCACLSPFPHTTYSTLLHCRHVAGSWETASASLPSSENVMRWRAGSMRGYVVRPLFTPSSRLDCLQYARMYCKQSKIGGIENLGTWLRYVQDSVPVAFFLVFEGLLGVATAPNLVIQEQWLHNG